MGTSANTNAVTIIRAITLFLLTGLLLTGLLLSLRAVAIEPWPALGKTPETAALAKERSQHLAIKNTLQKWLQHQYKNDIHPPDENATRQLALHHPVTGVTIPLFGNAPGADIHGHRDIRTLPLPSALIEHLTQAHPQLHGQWLFVVTNRAKQPLHILGTLADNVNDWPLFQALSDRHGAVDLTRLSADSEDARLGIIDVTQIDAIPLSLPTSSYDQTTDTVTLPKTLISVLKSLPQSQQDKLALTTVTGPAYQLHQSHLLNPLNAISATGTPDQIAINLLPATPPLMASPVQNNNHYRMDLVIGPGSARDDPIYLRLTGVLPTTRWLQADGGAITSIQIPAQVLLTLATSPHLHNQSLAILEHDPHKNRQIIHTLFSPNSGRSIRSILNNQQALTTGNTLDNAMITFNLPPPRPQRLGQHAISHPTRQRDDASDPDIPAPLRHEPKKVKAEQDLKQSPPLLHDHIAERRQRELQLDIRQSTREIDLSHRHTQQAVRIRKQREESKNSLVENANDVFQAIKAQKEKDSVLNKAARKQATTAPITPLPTVDRNIKGGANPSPKPTSGSVRHEIKISGQQEKRIRDMVGFRAEQEAIRKKELESVARREIHQEQQLAQQIQEIRNRPTAEEEQHLLAPHIEQHPMERFGRWLGNYAIHNPLHSAAVTVGVIATLNLLRQWWTPPDTRERLFRKTLQLMPASAPPFYHRALEELIQGTPEDLLHLWSPDNLNWWVSQACERWCGRVPCHARQMSDVFLHYVLAPVTTDRLQMKKEIALRITEQPIDSGDEPWLMAIALRRQGLPAAIDFNPVTRQRWLVELNDQGQLTRIDTTPDRQHTPIKVLRYSFLDTIYTAPHHMRYRKLLNQGTLTDVTNQYSTQLAPYPNERFRYGLYTCATIDGDNWWVLDIADSEPGLHALPALIGFAHETDQGRCKVSSMDAWLSILKENGQIIALSSIEPSPATVDLDLADLMRRVDKQYLNNDSCHIQQWHDRQWQTLSTTEAEAGILQAQLYRFVLYRLRCAAETTLFTLNDAMDMLDLWSWPMVPSSNS